MPAAMAVAAETDPVPCPAESTPPSAPEPTSAVAGAQEAIPEAVTDEWPAPDEPAPETAVVEAEVLETPPDLAAPDAAPPGEASAAGEEVPLAFYRAALEEFAFEHAQRTYHPNVNKGRTALFFAAVLILLFGTYSLVALLQSADSPVGGSGMLWLTCLAIIYAPAAVFFGLWSWAKKRPLTASLIGLALYPGYVAFLTHQSGGAPLLSFGNVIHVAVVLTLLYAVKCSWSYRKLMAAMPI